MLSKAVWLACLLQAAWMNAILAQAAPDTAWLNVSTVPGATDVVSNGLVVGLWQHEHLSNQSCSENWHDFYTQGPDYTFSKNSTNVSTSNSVATGKTVKNICSCLMALPAATLFKFSNDDSRVGVQIDCHQVSAASNLIPASLTMLGFSSVDWLRCDQPHVYRPELYGRIDKHLGVLGQALRHLPSLVSPAFLLL